MQAHDAIGDPQDYEETRRRAKDKVLTEALEFLPERVAEAVVDYLFTPLGQEKRAARDILSSYFVDLEERLQIAALLFVTEKMFLVKYIDTVVLATRDDPYF